MLRNPAYNKTPIWSPPSQCYPSRPFQSPASRIVRSHTKICAQIISTIHPSPTSQSRHSSTLLLMLCRAPQKKRRNPRQENSLTSISLRIDQRKFDLASGEVPSGKNRSGQNPPSPPTFLEAQKCRQKLSILKMQYAPPAPLSSPNDPRAQTNFPKRNQINSSKLVKQSDNIPLLTQCVL
jgi:hypothetical protein